MDVTAVRWHELRDSTGSAAAIPFLFAAIASGDAAAAESGLDRLGHRICQYDFVVGEATAPAVPFLWDLAEQPRVTCRTRVLRLLRHIADARQWEITAAAYPRLLHRPEKYVTWESAAREAVRAQRDAIPRLLTEDDPDVVRATAELASALAR
ncbi:hypothetical protein [Streptomyces sp. NPDC005423]|uniref:hypothetical protein n=1 Tax=Streptomyces sp. NPDC005423 TaxID=3155343 RepID=UPI0033B85E33